MPTALRNLPDLDLDPDSETDLDPDLETHLDPDLETDLLIRIFSENSSVNSDYLDYLVN